jgi:hypothetical protein
MAPGPCLRPAPFSTASIAVLQAFGPVTAIPMRSIIQAARMVLLAVGTGDPIVPRRQFGSGPVTPNGDMVGSGRAPAWNGLRDFRMLRHELVDALRTRCSFHSASVNRMPLPPFLPKQFPSLTFGGPLRLGVGRFRGCSARLAPHYGSIPRCTEHLRAPRRHDRSRMSPHTLVCPDGETADTRFEGGNLHHGLAPLLLGEFARSGRADAPPCLPKNS